MLIGTLLVSTPALVAMQQQERPGNKIECLYEQTALEEIKHIYDACSGNRQTIETYLLSEEAQLKYSSEVLPLLAKNWYLLYGNNRDFIAEELDYGFSIQELIDYNKLPAIRPTCLDLSKSRINDIEGIKNIPGVNTVAVIELSCNMIKYIPCNAFNGLGNLTCLNLSYNKIEDIRPKAFMGLGSLTYLYLTCNKLNKIDRQIFNGLNNLINLELRFNGLTEIQTNNFASLNNLKFLNLDDNSIYRIHKHAFAGMRGLTHLTLRRSLAEKIDPRVLSELSGSTLIAMSAPED